MNPLTQFLPIVLLFAAVIALLALWSTGFRRRSRVLALVNVAEGENLHGSKTYFADAATPARFLIVKAGSINQNVALATNADYPLGLATDSATLAGDPLAVDLFGATQGTKRVSTLSVINYLDWLVVDPANPGYALTRPTANGTYWVFGKAVNFVASAAGGDIIEFIPLGAPRQMTYAAGAWSVVG